MPTIDPQHLQTLKNVLSPSGLHLGDLISFSQKSEDKTLEGWDLYLEQNYEARDELARVVSETGLAQELQGALDLEALMEVATANGLYYLFKYLYLCKKVPLKLKTYKAHFPREQLHSRQKLSTEIETEPHIQTGAHESLTLDTSGRAAKGIKRIASLFENTLKSQSSYGCRLGGASWTYNKKALSPL